MGVVGGEVVGSVWDNKVWQPGVGVAAPMRRGMAVRGWVMGMAAAGVRLLEPMGSEASRAILQ